MSAGNRKTDGPADGEAQRRMPVAVVMPSGARDTGADQRTTAETPAVSRSVGATAGRAPRAAKPSHVRFTDDVFAGTAPSGADVTPAPARRFPFVTVFGAAMSALLALWLGAAVTEFAAGMLTVRPWLGWLAIGLAAIAALALAGFIAREIAGILRLEANSGLSRRIATAHAGGDLKTARMETDAVAALCARLPATAAARARLAATDTRFMNAAELVEATERELMAPLDAEARRQVVDAAKRVSVVTAVSPRAFVDIGYVLFENARLIRAIAEIYGCRPGAFSFIRLARAALAHLAVTGVVAMGDSLVQQIVGHGVAARLSARLGEGVLNGVMTARIGFAAMDVTRPMPVIALDRPGVSSVLGELSPLSRSGEAEKR
jgi:putative membrane protein